ncbi:MAG: protein kinase [Gemmatimonadetes bacterium]|nr:protein kinase [Gemmatimonadota bacterium]
MQVSARTNGMSVDVGVQGHTLHLLRDRSSRYRHHRMSPRNPFSIAAVEGALAGRFDIDRELRVGGQGIVYMARRTKAVTGEPTAELVALKVHTDPTQDDRVEREIQAMERLRHPNLATLVEHGAVEIDGEQTRFVAWEFIAGSALDDRLKAAPSLAMSTVARIGRDVARAIGHIWSEQRIVHRDVNPKNIMLKAGEREAVLIDLGVARHLEQATLTAAGVTWGTLGYLSPEQCRAEPQLTCASDIFSLAISLQEALAGRHPTSGDQRPLIANPPKTEVVAPQTPVGLAKLIDAMYALRAPFRPKPSELAERFAELAEQL